MISRVEVECYAGYKADERPVRFYLGQREYRVVEVVDQWYSPSATYFRVRGEDGHLYVLRHSIDPADEWTLESFRRG
ncbi:MAG TPA: hypothetical protein PLA43_05715 [Bryobacteraceae bacterium]|nr:hypothetical protein [Bryobacteraceae bacterium]HPQ13870.1 hypothetical protein [Bryobacteraceae bacterium]HPU71433.1 hypothetical protein [Bryobacteraceae bacterium]